MRANLMCPPIVLTIERNAVKPMLPVEQIEEMIQLVQALDRVALVEQLHHYRANFPLDFSSEFLQGQPTERLRHIFLALCLHTQRMPDFATPEAA